MSTVLHLQAHRSGLDRPRRLARALGGDVTASNVPGSGARVSAQFQASDARVAQ